MKLKQILSGIDGLKAKGNLDKEIKKIESDSRKINKDDMFIAIKGYEVDGHEYIENAIQNGATAVIVEDGVDLKKIKLPEEITLIIAPNTRRTLAIAAANFYKNPSKNLKLIGITGTKGKTTTAFMIKQILEKQNKKVGLIGSIAVYIGNEKLKDSERTTPGSLELQEIFSKMLKEKVEYVVMEVSSQSLMLDRVYGCQFDSAIFTNFSEDHISEHEHADMQNYFDSKLKLFNMCNIAYINSDNLYTIKLKKIKPELEIKTYGIDNASDLLAKDITVMNSSVDFKIKLGTRNEIIKVAIPGRFCVYNALAAISVALRYGATVEQIKEAMLEICVPGRSELVPNSKELNIMIDYAHTPDSLENILHTVKTYTKGNVILVFGCGGDRDSAKREIMGKIAGKIADITYITSDNPRSEDPQKIISQIENGIKLTNGKYECIADRKKAIKKAISIATKRDFIILAGKGHETYQEINGKKNHFDEREIVKEITDKK